MSAMQQARRAGLTGAGVALGVTLSLVGSAVSIWIAALDDQSMDTVVFGAVVALSFALVGAVVAAARPDNSVGWLMLGAGVAWAIGNAGVDVAQHGIVAAPGSVPGATAYALAGAAVRAIGWWGLVIGLPMLFPSGRLVGSHRRWLPRAYALVLVCSAIDPLTAPDGDLPQLGHWDNPIALPSGLQWLNSLAFFASIPLGTVCLGFAIAGLVGRWRRGSALERQQLGLFAVAACLPIVAAPVALLGGNIGWVFGPAVLLLPFAVGFAVLARGLYDLRTATNRTLVWGLLSAVVGGVYALVIASLDGLFGVHGGGWTSWLAAGVIAISFAPLRDGLQRLVNRLTFGRWDEPYDVLADLGQRLEASTDVERLLAHVAVELGRLGLAEVRIIDAEGSVLAGRSQPSGDPVVMPLTAYGQAVGTLCYLRPTWSERARDRRLLDDLAGHLGGVLHAYELTGDLQRARERLVLAREEERRRLRRDLHDGLGPALAGHLLRLDVIAGKVGRKSAASADIDALRDELRGTVGEIRRVVEGLRPPALDELGLAGTLAQVTQRLTAGSPLNVDLQIADLPQLPAAMEVAVVRIVTEAVTNAVRHAGASRARVTIEMFDAMLRVTICDDGRGFDDRIQGPPRSGNGMETMRERAEELRGRLTVDSDNSGTTVTVNLPHHAPTAASTFLDVLAGGQ
jgi:signal transduction histidine kinase